MRLLFSIVFIYILSTSPGKKDWDPGKTIMIDKGLYLVEYSEKLEQPVMVEYEVMCSSGEASRKGMDFFREDGIHTSDDKDYERNIWDKGHMAPAASFNCSRDTLKEVFSYINCALQHQNLNRGQWRELESLERKIASEGKDVLVKIDIIFSKDSKVLPTGATVPDSFVKHIMVNGRFQCYSFLNSEGSSNYSNHRIECLTH